MRLRKNAKVELIKRVPLFSELGRRELNEVAGIADEIDLREGTELTKEGSPGREFFVLIDGTADVKKGSRRVNRLGPGDFFGEISLLTSEAPNADIVALSMLRCLVVPGPEFEPFLLEYPRVLFRILQAEARRLRDTTSWRIGS